MLTKLQITVSYVFYKDVLNYLRWKYEGQKFCFKLKLISGNKRCLTFSVCFLIPFCSFIRVSYNTIETRFLFLYISPAIVYHLFNLQLLWLYICRGWPGWVKMLHWFDVRLHEHAALAKHQTEARDWNFCSYSINWWYNSFSFDFCCCYYSYVENVFV